MTETYNTPNLTKLECVVTCVNYADFLAHTLPHNRTLFDNMVVVTTPEDKATQRVCEYWHVRCVQTKRFNENASFRKGAGINAGLDVLKKDAWIVHMDADIMLPPLFKNLIQGAELDPTMVYGCDRFMSTSYQEWAEFVTTPRLQHENNVFIHTSSFPIGVRIFRPNYGGYIPIGFFQMWHGSSGVDKYPEEHTTAGRGDMLFAAKWPRAKRGFLPEIIAYHLESEKVKMAANWNGRTTQQFGPPQVEGEAAPLDLTSISPYLPAEKWYQKCGRFVRKIFFKPE